MFLTSWLFVIGSLLLLARLASHAGCSRRDAIICARR